MSGNLGGRTALGWVLWAASALFNIWPFAARAEMPVMALSAGVHLIQAEVASTATSRQEGLMFRRALGPNRGMLFVFPESARHCMWMRNTYISLSVAFMDEHGNILNIDDMQPETESNHCAARPARYALEMSHGWFAQRGIAVGHRIAGVEEASEAR
jgi:uncharacterized membrane protein (UPF0127 family)